MFYSNSWTKCLIYLIFITSGNSECPKPQVERNEHVVLTNDALLKNDFPEGSEVLFQCTNGYMKAQGSESITCTSGEWSTLELICKKKDCGAPKEMPHLTYEFDKEGTLFGASARAICDKGYQIQGSSYRQCYATGWSGRSRCEDVNDIPLKSASITTSTVPPTIQVSGRHHEIGEHDINAATRNAAAKGSVIGICIVIVILIVLFVLYCFQKRKGSYQTGEDSRRKEELLQFQND
ncbi:complement decay-accelerating factor isoform X7 [Oncorhynchus kisutch]|uniref:complement decay-accelerating factor isoform X7 n=1 Tax=Oncorhynchus kisutch TaxID=8019 RepID=UPI0012DD71AB|nr:complement decay-accelerating factor isoform X7 [Oncorhynchus kisutch]